MSFILNDFIKRLRNFRSKRYKHHSPVSWHRLGSCDRNRQLLKHCFLSLYWFALLMRRNKGCHQCWFSTDFRQGYDRVTKELLFLKIPTVDSNTSRRVPFNKELTRNQRLNDDKGRTYWALLLHYYAHVAQSWLPPAGVFSLKKLTKKEQKNQIAKR